MLEENFILQLPGVGDATNKEINEAISASDDVEIQSGPWVYLDLQDAIKK
jgi:hypothetical protein